MERSDFLGVPTSTQPGVVRRSGERRLEGTYNVIPEIGQLVEVRRRRWVVSDIDRHILSTVSGETAQHRISLASVEEDALGDTLEAIWELEPGARVLETTGLPHADGWDSAERLEGFLDAVRWGAVTSADRNLLQAPFRSGATIEDYQLDPLVRAIDMARANLLIADDVGLGKTIEAGLIVQELLLRHRARSVWVVCPASLLTKWKGEMQEKFGLEFRIVDSEYVRKLRRERGIHANPWASFPRLIASMDWMKSGDALRLLTDVLPVQRTFPRKFDILIVDEVHNVAPSSVGNYAVESQRTRLIRRLVPHFEHRLFLSATPHNGYRESFTSLLELLDDQRFARNVLPDEKQLRRTMVRRLKTDLVDAAGKPLYPKREILPLEIGYSEEERNIHKALRRYTESRMASVKGTKFEFGGEFVHMLLKKRLFSSPSAFASTLEKHRESMTAGYRRHPARAVEERILRKAIQRTEEEYADDDAKESALAEVVEGAGDGGVPVTVEQQHLLSELTSWADRARNRADSKAEAIMGWIEAHLCPQGVWGRSRVILFTEYRDTQSWLQRLLAAHGFGGDRLMLLNGGMLPDERDRIKAAFQADPAISPVRILLATDAASEGIDLQNRCNYLIHVEIPWNPNVMEQRNGRIDRHGQREPSVHIWHPVGKGTKLEGASATSVRVGELEGDLEYLARAARKVEAIRTDLGSVGPVIAKQIEEAMRGHRTILDTRDAETRATRSRSLLVAEQRQRQRVVELHARLLDTKEESGLSPERIARAVHVALSLAGLPPLEQISDDPTAFAVPDLPGSWGRATGGLAHPHTGYRRPITFDHERLQGRDDVVLAHLNHPLVQMCLRLLRAEVWAMEDTRKLNRVALRLVPDDMLSVPAVAIRSRLVITGGGHHRLHEELHLTGGKLGERGFSRMTASELETLLGGATPCEPVEALFKGLSERYRRNTSAISTAVEARSADRLGQLLKTLDRRCRADAEDIATVLDELEKAIRRELAEPEPQQLTLWEDVEREQRDRDTASLQIRLARIPEERTGESEAIKRRFADPHARTFPVAAIFLVPSSIVERGTL
jgi:superfamily II DNA or RNA helicase